MGCHYKAMIRALTLAVLLTGGFAADAPEAKPPPPQPEARKDLATDGQTVADAQPSPGKDETKTRNDDDKVQAKFALARSAVGNPAQADAVYTGMHTAGKNLRNKGAPRSDLEALVENLRKQGLAAESDQKTAVVTLQVLGAMDGWNGTLPRTTK